MYQLFNKKFKVACHTSNVMPGGTFVAIPGTNLNGIDFIPEAINAGASQVIIQTDVLLPNATEHLCREKNITIEYVENTRAALAYLSAAAYNFPADKLKIIGITGTKGKSSTTLMTAHLLRSAGYNVALLSTIYNQILDDKYAAPLTTAQPDYLHCFLNECVERGVTHVVMETAAQAFSLHRLDGIKFYSAVFTNFAAEHAEFYASMDDYFAAKKQLFNQLASDGIKILNADDSSVAELYSPENSLSYSFEQKSNAAFFAKILGTTAVNTTLLLELLNQAASMKITVPYVGKFNAYNAVAAVAVAVRCGVSLAQVAEAFTVAPEIPGRMERYKLKSGATVVIDYAHNPQSYQAVLSELRPLASKLVIVCGAGGDRDASKRPLMGAIAAEYADQLYLTTDNPRSEDPAKIVGQMITGIPTIQRAKITVELDRKAAIGRACMHAQPHDVVLLFGKGAERYQQIGTEKIPFDERLIIKNL